ncbi:MAG: ubiquitin-like small modifier protein 1 [Candidatus Hodarchaeota archaeon]
MISVNIRLFAAFRELIGEKEIRLELGSQEKYTILDVLNKLIETKGIAIKSKLLDGEGNLRKGVQIFINGMKIHISNKIDAPVKNDDIIAILPTVGGG